MRGQRGLVFVDLQYEVLASFVLAQRVQLVTFLLLPDFGGEAQHDLLELGFLACSDF